VGWGREVESCEGYERGVCGEGSGLFEGMLQLVILLRFDANFFQEHDLGNAFV
jgi:hypothetical protein